MQATDIRTALNDLLNRQDCPLEVLIDRHMSADYRQRTDGHWSDRDAFVRHVRQLREVVASADIDVLDELREGNRYADRHRVRLTKRDGTRVLFEVYLFAELDANGRFTRVEETTLLLEGAEADQELAK